MNTPSFADFWFDRIEQIELPICTYFNRANKLIFINKFFKLVSRLGNGVFWYSLITIIVLVGGAPAVSSAIHIMFTGAVGVIVYKFLKDRLIRERPFITHAAISCNTQPLDHYSFPSGHTLHAVNFCILILFYYPNLSWVVVPFAILVALSRFILGLHYISDVVAGGLIGASLALLSLQVAYVSFI